MNHGKNIAVLITCHNRAQTTLRCLKYLYASNLPDEYGIAVYLTNDGSTDETSGLIEKNFPNTIIIEGDGSLYWNRGMYSSWMRALNNKHDFYLLLNDDVELQGDAILNLVNLYWNSSYNSVIVGKTIDPISRQTTYGALKRRSWISRNSFIPITAKSDSVVTFNANCVLIPNNATESVGILDPFYTQQFGDIDLGLRFHSQGWDIVELTQPVAYLTKNFAYTHANFHISFKGVKNLLVDPKGIPIREWWHFLYKFNGFLAFFYFFYRYIKVLFPGFKKLFFR